MVGALGVNQAWLFTAVFALGTLLAGLAGALQLAREPASLEMDMTTIGAAFVIVVVGGMGSFGGALVGGLLIGVVQSVMSTVWPEGARLMIYVAMAAVLLLRPHGLLGRKG